MGHFDLLKSEVLAKLGHKLKVGGVRPQYRYGGRFLYGYKEWLMPYGQLRASFLFWHMYMRTGCNYNVQE